MKPRWMAPFALLPAGCATAPLLHTPSVELELDPPLPPARTEVPAPPASVAMAAWTLPPSVPWAPFSRYTLLASLGEHDSLRVLPIVSTLPGVQRAKAVARVVAERGLPEDALWIVDLPGPESVAFGAELAVAADTPVSPVLTFQNWTYEREAVPTVETLAALLAFRPILPSADARSVPVFLLDAWRLAFAGEAPSPDAVDNRYALNVGDLPDPELLIERGIRSVIYVIERRDGLESEADDLNPRLLEYQGAGIQISLMDLDDLWGTPEELPEGRWSWSAARRRLMFSVAERSTCLKDPEFYHRHRSAFGGLNAGLSAGRWGSTAFHLAHGGG